MCYPEVSIFVFKGKIAKLLYNCHQICILIVYSRSSKDDFLYIFITIIRTFPKLKFACGNHLIPYCGICRRCFTAPWKNSGITHIHEMLLVILSSGRFKSRVSIFPTNLHRLHTRLVRDSRAVCSNSSRDMVPKGANLTTQGKAKHAICLLSILKKIFLYIPLRYLSARRQADT